MYEFLYGEDAMNAKKIQAFKYEDKKSSSPSRLGGSIIFPALSG